MGTVKSLLRIHFFECANFSCRKNFLQKIFLRIIIREPLSSLQVRHWNLPAGCLPRRMNNHQTHNIVLIPRTHHLPNLLKFIKVALNQNRIHNPVKNLRWSFLQKMINGWKPWNTFATISILDVWQGSEYASVNN